MKNSNARQTDVLPFQSERISCDTEEHPKCEECKAENKYTCRYLVAQNPNSHFCCGKRERDAFTACFPSTARVSLENGETVTMAELRRGDKVQTGRKEYRHYLVV